jgi:hypothetical protein
MISAAYNHINAISLLFQLSALYWKSTKADTKKIE